MTEIRPGHILKLNRGFDAAEDRVPFFRAQLALVDAFGQDLGDGLQTPLHKFLGDIAHEHHKPAHGRHLGDAVAHLAGAHHANGFYLHLVLVSSRVTFRKRG